jgi:hypothetical protein
LPRAGTVDGSFVQRPTTSVSINQNTLCGPWFIARNLNWQPGDLISIGKTPDFPGEDGWAYGHGGVETYNAGTGELYIRTSGVWGPGVHSNWEMWNHDIVISGMIRPLFKPSRPTGSTEWFIEGRLKLAGADVQGHHLGFWGVAHEHWPYEYDFVEVVNNGGGFRENGFNSFHNVHNQGSPNFGTLTRSEFGPHAGDGYKAVWPTSFSTRFANFACRITPSDCHIYVDDEKMWRHSTYFWVDRDGNPGQPMNIIINAVYGGKWPGPNITAASFPTYCEVDNIRVWRRN